MLRTIQVFESLVALLSVLKSSFFVELCVSPNNVKLSSLTKSGVTMGAVYLRAAVMQYSGWISLFSCYLLSYKFTECPKGPCLLLN
jgi:hypothetical protein